MRKYLYFFILPVLFISCQTGPTKVQYNKLQEQNKKLKNELENSKKTINELNNIPERRLARALKYQADNDIFSAQNELSDLIATFPETDEAQKAEVLLKKIKVAKEKEIEEEIRKKTLGFKSLKSHSVVKVGSVSLHFTSIDIRKRWVFDDYGYKYFYRSAERGDKYVVARVSISSQSKDPNLPPIYVFIMKNGELTYEGTFEYRFARWRDYGSYLGNYADYGNDFAHTKTIRFSCGYELSDDYIKDDAIFIVVGNTNSFKRHYDKFENPPVSYSEDGYYNGNGEYSLTVDNFDYNYQLITILNKNKL